MSSQHGADTDVSKTLSSRDALDLALTHWRLLSTVQRGDDTIETADDGEADAYRQCKATLNSLAHTA